MIYNIILEAAQPKGGFDFIFLIVGLVILYFFMIYPQMKKQKKAKKFREEIGEGTKVVTIGGVHGKIVKIHEDGTMIIESEGTKLRFDRSAISVEATEALNKDDKEKK